MISFREFMAAGDKYRGSTVLSIKMGFLKRHSGASSEGFLEGQDNIR